MAIPAVILRTPNWFIPSTLCGPSVVELMRFYRGDLENPVVGGAEVTHHIWGGMLPGHMYAELLWRSFNVVEGNAKESTALERLKELLGSKRPVLLFVGKGVGHWIAVWGYEGDTFFVYDVAKGVKRDVRGLTRYSGAELLRQWKNYWFWRMKYGPYYYITVR